MNTDHTCHAIGCTEAVPPRMLMCLKHWKLVHRETQKLVWKAYRPGQERDKQASAVYLIIQAMAVGQVAVSEGLWTVEQCLAFVEKRSLAVWDKLSPEENIWLKSLMDDYAP